MREPVKDELRLLLKAHRAAAAAALTRPQGPQLEQEGLQIGVVTAIAAPAALRVSFSGGRARPAQGC